MRRPFAYVLVALVPAMLALGIWLGGHPDRLPGPVADALVGDRHGRLVDEVLRDIEDDYYRKVDAGRLTNRAVDGMVAALGDRYSHYFTPAQYARYRRDTNAQFAGVGIEVRPARKGLLVVHVYQDSPARRAGIRRGDVIVAAGRRSLAGLSTTRSSDLVRGRPGTQVRLTTVRGGRRMTVTVTRALVSVPVVASKMRRAPGGREVAQVALSSFTNGAHGELRQQVDERLKQGAKAILLDLRHNGGGLVSEARLVASTFIPDGRIVTIRGRNEPTTTLDAVGDAIDPQIPLAVLVDGQTASAAEIVAGAIQDRHRGTIVGTHTYGKGVFQQVSPLSNGGALDITVGEYFLPGGRNLGGGGVRRGQGIQPDVKASDDPRTPGDDAVTAGLRVLGRELQR